jgi:hypothetical protein
VPFSDFTIQYGPVHRNRNFPGIKPDRDGFSDSEPFLIPLPMTVYERLS